jgi:hypothetical protein
VFVLSLCGIPVPCAVCCVCASDFGCSTQDLRLKADDNCRDGPVFVVLAAYDKENTTVKVWTEPLHQIEANYWIDPWNQGMLLTLVAVCLSAQRRLRES